MLQNDSLSQDNTSQKSKAGAVVAVACVVIALVIAVIAGTLLSKKGKNNSDISFEIDGEYDFTKVIEADDNNGGIGDHTRGSTDSEVIVVEYADLQCPGCASMMSSMHKLYEEYGDRVTFVFRNYPLSGHQNARAAAAAVEAAGLQGKYWEMLETLYANRGEWISESGNTLINVFKGIFKDIAPDGDLDKFLSDMNSNEVLRKVSFDRTIGYEEAQVQSTPTFFVNGKNIDSSDVETIGDWKNKIENEIKSALGEAD